MATGQEEEIKGEIAGANPQRRAKTGHCRLRKKKDEQEQLRAEAEKYEAKKKNQGGRSMFLQIVP
jgi:hypothetical protein